MKRYILVLVTLILVLTINVSIPVNATSVPITVPIPVDVTNQLIELANQLGIDTSELTLANLKTFVTENEDMQKFLKYFKIVQATFDVMALKGNPLILDDIAKDLANNNHTNEENVIAIAYDQYKNGDSGAIRYIKNSATVNSIEYQFHAWYRLNFKYENGNYIITTKNYAYDGSVYYMDNICPNFEDTFKYIPSEFLDSYIQMQDDLRALTFQTVGAMTILNTSSGTQLEIPAEYSHIADAVIAFENAKPNVTNYLCTYIKDIYNEYFIYFNYTIDDEELNYVPTDYKLYTIDGENTTFNDYVFSSYSSDNDFNNYVYEGSYTKTSYKKTISYSVSSLLFEFSTYDMYDLTGTLVYEGARSDDSNNTIYIPNTRLINLSDGSIAVDEDDAIEDDDVEIDVEEDEDGLHTGIYVPGISEGLSIAFGDGIEADFSQLQDSFINKLGTSNLSKAWEKFNSLQQSNEPPKITINLNALFNTASNFTEMTDAFGPDGDEFVLIDFACLEEYEFMGMTLIAFIRMVIGTTMVITTVLSLKNAIHPSKAVAS